MIENINDVFSLFILFVIPFSVLVVVIRSILSKRKHKIRKEEGKYYPEW